MWLRAGPDGMLAGGDAIGVLSIWRDVTAPPMTLIGHSGAIEDLHWHPGGKLVATASLDGTARLWRIDGPEPVSRTLLAHAGRITALAFSPDGDVLATGGEDGALYLWQDTLPAQPDALRGRIGELLAARALDDAR